MNSRHPGRPKSEGPWSQCKVSGCSATTKGGSRGFCHRHYIYARRGIFDWDTGEQIRPFLRVGSYGPGASCSISNCQRKARAEGLCSAHWQRKKKGQPLDLPIKERALEAFIKCLLPGCSKRASSHGMCASHAAQRESGLIDVAGNKLREPYSMGRGRPRLADRWIGRDGYTLVKAPVGHPHARQDGSMLEHRLVMEQSLGRYLNEWELVHHKDGNRHHNQLSNLELLDGRAKNGGPGHPPGHDFDRSTAIQVLLQMNDLPEDVRTSLESYRTTLVIR